MHTNVCIVIMREETVHKKNCLLTVKTAHKK